MKCFRTLLLLFLLPLSLHAESDRPKVGLALGGGGAKGFAHVGVLKVLEELQVPVDYIAGTSMGSIIGGFYAAGLSPDEIGDALTAIDWWDLLDDHTRRPDLPFRRKRDDARYLLNLELGFNDFQLSLPSGLASGQKMNNFLESVTLHTAGLKSFDDLHIPYRAVATDVRIGEEVVLGSGNLAQAMRASMAVPGAFTPVTIDNRLLVDGGLVNNIPVSVVRDMGADIVIAVNVGHIEEVMKIADLESAAGIASQMYLILKKDAEDLAMQQADIGLYPETRSVSASAFHEAGSLFPVGEASARAAADQLSSLRVGKEEFDVYLARQRKGETHPPRIDAINIRGNERVDERIIRNKIRTAEGQVLDTDKVTRDTSLVYGLGDFQQVVYSVQQDEAGDTLDYNVTEKPWGPGYLKFGFKLDTDGENHTDWGVLINYTRTRINELGAEWWNDFLLGSDQRLISEFYQPLDYYGFFFLMPRVELVRYIQDLYEGNDKVAELQITRGWGQLYGGMQFGRWGELRAGVARGFVDADEDVGDLELEDDEDDLAGVPIRFTMDRLDRAVFPRHGYLFMADAFLSRKGLGSSRTFDRLDVGYNQRATKGDHTLILSFIGGTSFGSTLPVYADFTLGGLFSFSGLAEDQLRGDYYGRGRLGYLYRLAKLPPTFGRGLYIGGWGDAGNTWNNSGDIDADDLVLGSALGLGADTIVGPVYLGYGQAEGGNERVYFSVGTAF